MAPAGRERQTARGAAGQQRRGRQATPSPTRPRLTYRPGPAAAALGPQPHRGAASGAACVISARPSTRGAQRTRLHFRPRLKGEVGEPRSVEGGGACVGPLKPVTHAPRLASRPRRFMSVIQSDLAPTVRHFFLLCSLYGGERENLRDVSKVKQRIDITFI